MIFFLLFTKIKFIIFEIIKNLFNQMITPLILILCLKLLHGWFFKCLQFILVNSTSKDTFRQLNLFDFTYIFHGKISTLSHHIYKWLVVALRMIQFPCSGSHRLQRENKFFLINFFLVKVKVWHDMTLTTQHSVECWIHYFLDCIFGIQRGGTIGHFYNRHFCFNWL